MLRNLEDDDAALVLYFERILDGRQFLVKTNVDDRTDDLRDDSFHKN